MAGKKKKKAVGKKKRRRREAHSLVGNLSIESDYIETALPEPGNYILRVLCDCNRRVTLAVRRYSHPHKVPLGEQQVVFTPNTGEPVDVPFTSATAGDSVKVAIASINGGFNGNISLEMDCEVLTELEEFPIDNASLSLTRIRGRRG